MRLFLPRVPHSLPHSLARSLPLTLSLLFTRLLFCPPPSSSHLHCSGLLLPVFSDAAVSLPLPSSSSSSTLSLVV